MPRPRRDDSHQHDHRFRASVGTETADNSCVICFKNARINAVGCCDHFVCFECSTRMRVLCDQIECPICRQDNVLVVFTGHSYPFEDYADKYATMLFEKPFGIYFETVEIKKEYLKLLYHKCKICEKYFDSATELNGHLQRQHNVSFCSLCLENLKIFTFERRYYDKSRLSKHMKSGDDDDKSHRGHPLCQFCRVHFMDSDELFKHMRREHLYCHLCDSIGKIEFYETREHLNQHVRKVHFYCNDDKCNQLEFVLPFATEIDLKRHIATEHDHGHSRAERKLLRTLDLDFRFKPKATYEREEHIFNPFNVVPDSGTSATAYQRNVPPDRVRYQFNDNNFPSLETNVKSHTRLNTAWDTRNPVVPSANERNAKPTEKKDQFPVLGQAKVPAVSEPIRWAPEPKKEPPPPDKKAKENNANKQSQMTTFIVTKRPGDFPALKPLAPKPSLLNGSNAVLTQQATGKGTNGASHSGSCLPLASATTTIATAPAKKKKNKDWHENVFLRPPNFDERNKKLGEKLMHLFSVSAVDEFRKKSQLYRDGFIDARAFYETCRQLMANKFGELFVELLVLLPDIRKQNELYLCHLNEFVFNHKLAACPVCKQILKKNELPAHQKFHDESESVAAAAAAERNFNSLTIS